MIQICLYYLGNPLTLSNERVIEDFFSSIAFKSTIASNKQRQKHNNLASIESANLKGAHERSKSLQFVKPRTQMHILTRMNKVVIEDFYHMTTMDEDVNWMKLTHLLWEQIFKPQDPPFVHLHLLQTFNSLSKCARQRIIIPPPYVYYER